MSTTFKNTRLPRGFSLLEMMFVVTMLAVTLLAVSMSLISSQNAIELTAIQTTLDSKAHDIAERIGNDLRDASVQTIGLTPGTGDPALPTNYVAGSLLTFRKCTGWDAVNKVQTLTPLMMYYMVQDTAKTINGVSTKVCHLEYVDANGNVNTLTDQLQPPSAGYVGGFYFYRNTGTSADQITITVDLNQKYHLATTTKGTDAQGYLTYTSTANVNVTLHN